MPELNLEDFDELAKPIVGVESNIDKGGFRQVSREIVGTHLVVIDFSPRYVMLPAGMGVSGSEVFNTCAIARMFDLSRDHGRRGEFAHHTEHFITRDYNYGVYYFPDSVRSTELSDDLHAHIKEVFRTALLLHNLPFASKVNW